MDTIQMNQVEKRLENETPMEYVNRTGFIPCFICNKNIYQVKNNKKFMALDIISAKDFSGIDGISDPYEHQKLDCPSCRHPLILAYGGSKSGN